MIMPTTYAHYRLGENVRKILPEHLQQLINKNEELFHIGVHGPDHMFYYNPVISTKVGKTGSRIHKEPGKKFFAAAAQVIHKCEKKEAHLAFAYGYLCHFAMDYVCHGYVGNHPQHIPVHRWGLLTKGDGADGPGSIFANAR